MHLVIQKQRSVGCRESTVHGKARSDALPMGELLRSDLAGVKGTGDSHNRARELKRRKNSAL
jgi:hypothetical protein